MLTQLKGLTCLELPESRCTQSSILAHLSGLSNLQQLSFGPLKDYKCLTALQSLTSLTQLAMEMLYHRRRKLAHNDCCRQPR